MKKLALAIAAALSLGAAAHGDTGLTLFSSTTNYIQLLPAAGMSTVYKVNLPLNPGTTNQVLSIKSVAGNVLTSSWTTQSGGGGSSVWGGITGTLSDQADLQAALNGIGTSTATLATQIVAVGVSTGTLLTRIVAVGVDTATLRTSITALGVSTGSLQTQVTATGVSTGSLQTQITAVGVSTGALAVSTGSLQVQINALNVSTAAIGVSTGTILTRVIQVGLDTATLRTSLNQVATDTTTLGANFPVSLSTNVTGSLPDTRLSANVPLLNSTQTWTGGNTWISSHTFRGTINVSSSVLLSGAAGNSGQVLTSGGANAIPTWTSPLAGVLPGGATSYIQNTSALQSGATAYPDFIHVGSSASVEGAGGLNVRYNVNAGSVTGANLSTCGDATHAVGYSATTGLFSCQSVTGSGGSSASTLAVTTGASTGFSGAPVSSPTAIIVFDQATTNGQLLASSTYFFTLKSSSVTLQSNTFNANNALLQLDGSAKVPAGQFPILTGDITTAGGSLATTLAASIAGNKNWTGTSTHTSSVTINNAGTTNALGIVQSGNIPASSQTGGAINVTNTSNTGGAVVVYSNQAAPVDNLINIRVDQPTFSQNAIFVDFKGGGTNAANLAPAVTIRSSVAAFGYALNVVGRSSETSTFQVSGEEATKGSFKVTHTSPTIQPGASDANASAISISLAGAGTAAQGIFMDAGSGTSGKLLNLRQSGVEQLVLGADGTLTLKYSVVAATMNLTAFNATTTSATVTGGSGLTVTDLSASLPTQTDANKHLVSLAVDLSGTQAGGTLAAARFPALTGDITTSAGNLATTLAGSIANQHTWTGTATHTSSVTVNSAVWMGSAGNAVTISSNAVMPGATFYQSGPVQMSGFPVILSSFSFSTATFQMGSNARISTGTPLTFAADGILVSSSGVNLYQFTTSGVTLFNIPPWAKQLRFRVCGSGGGGGGGEGRASLTARGGGSGGGGGACQESTYDTAYISTFVAVNVGAGGAVGTGGNANVGVDGGVGNASFIYTVGGSTWIFAGGGGQGNGDLVAADASGGAGGGSCGAGATGSNTTTAGGCPQPSANVQGQGGAGAGSTITSAGKVAEWGGGSGGAGGGTGVGFGGGGSEHGNAGGAGAGGCTTGNVCSAPGAGGTTDRIPTLNAGGGAAGTSGASCTAGGNGPDGTPNRGASGGGGGGSDQDSTAAACTGGNGGICGGGGGGGGAGTSVGANGGLGGVGCAYIWAY